MEKNVELCIEEAKWESVGATTKIKLTKLVEGCKNANTRLYCMAYHLFPVTHHTERNKILPIVCLLHSSGLLLPGLNAIMGPTGSGKST